MAEYSAGGLSTAGSTTLPIAALVGGTGGRVILREIGITNTTDTAVALKLVRITSAGTPGASVTEAKHDPDSATPVGVVNGTYSSSGPSLGDDLGYRAQIAAAKGAGVTWVKGSRGIVIPATANNGIAIIVENGTGQACQYYFVWEE